MVLLSLYLFLLPDFAILTINSSNNLFFHYELPHDLKGRLDINLRIYFNTFSMNPSHASDSDAINI